MGIRTPVTGVKSPCPRPLDDGGLELKSDAVYRRRGVMTNAVESVFLGFGGQMLGQARTNVAATATANGITGAWGVAVVATFSAENAA